MRTVSNRQEFDCFLEQLLESERLPVVAVSEPTESRTPAFPIEKLEAEIGDGAHVWVLEPHATFWLTDELGRRLSVYSGWVRVYPSNPGWRTDERRAPLLQARPDAKRWLRAVVDTVLEVAYRDGYRPPVTVPDSVPATAKVSGVLTATQVMVHTANRRQAAMQTHHLWPGLPADRLVATGQEFAGCLLPGALLPEFIPDPPRQDVPARVAEFVDDGIVTLTRVARVTPHTAELLVHPEYAVTLEDADVDLREVLRANEVVTIEIVPMEDAFLSSFSSDEPAQSMSVLPGGPPWLVYEPPAAELDADEPAAAPEAALAGPESWLYREVERLEQQISELEEENRQLRRRERERSRIAVPKLFADPEEQLRLELHLAYLSRVPESERRRYPWPQTYAIKPLFLESMDDLVGAGGISREKVVEVCVEVLSGLAIENNSRAVKEWLESRHGRPSVRGDGATAWRVRLQHKSNAARRLRYWRLPSGAIELDWVGVHDADLR